MWCGVAAVVWLRVSVMVSHMDIFTFSFFFSSFLPLMLRLDFTHTQIHWTASFLFSLPHTEALVRYNLPVLSRTIWSFGSFLYDINLGATATTILRIRGVQIPIDLVNSAMDSYRRSVVLFKPMSVLTSDPKSEFLYQSSSIVHDLQTSPWTTSYAWDISHTLVTTYHPYCHSPSALTEYLKQRLRLQRAKRLGRSLPAQVEQSVQLERNNWPDHSGTFYDSPYFSSMTVTFLDYFNAYHTQITIGTVLFLLHLDPLI